MGSNDGAERLIAADGVTRNRRRRSIVLAGATFASLLLILNVLFGVWLHYAWRGEEDQVNRLPAGVLGDYVPEDSAAVLAVNVRQLRESLSEHQHLRALLQQLVKQAQGRLPWLDLTAINLLDDLDTLLISFASNGSGEPVLLARSRPDCSRFQISPDKLQAKILDGFHVWEYNDPSSKQNTLLVVVGDTLVVSKATERVQAALKQASNPQPVRVRDATLRELLAKADRRQNLWLAASIKRLGPVSEIDDYLLRILLRPLLTHAESVYGGITCDEDVRAELHFSTSTVEDADRLEADLKSISELAPGAALLGRQNELLPLLRLLAAGRVRREGQTILLSCQLTADQLEK